MHPSESRGAGQHIEIARLQQGLEPGLRTRMREAEDPARSERQPGDDRAVILFVDVRPDARSTRVSPQQDMVWHIAKDAHRRHAGTQGRGPRRNGLFVWILTAGRQRPLTTFIPVEMREDPALELPLLVDRDEGGNDAKPRGPSADDHAGAFVMLRRWHGLDAAPRTRLHHRTNKSGRGGPRARHPAP